MAILEESGSTCLSLLSHFRSAVSITKLKFICSHQPKREFATKNSLAFDSCGPKKLVGTLPGSTPHLLNIRPQLIKMPLYLYVIRPVIEHLSRSTKQFLSFPSCICLHLLSPTFSPIAISVSLISSCLILFHKKPSFAILSAFLFDSAMTSNTSPKAPSFVFEYLPKKSAPIPSVTLTASPNFYDRTSSLLSSFVKTIAPNPRLSVSEARHATLAQAKTSLESYLAAKHTAGVAISASEMDDLVRIERAMQGHGNDN